MTSCDRFLSLGWLANLANWVPPTRVEGGGIGCSQQRRTTCEMMERGAVDSFGSHEQADSHSENLHRSDSVSLGIPND
jgi:hypothetical protein